MAVELSTTPTNDSPILRVADESVCVAKVARGLILNTTEDTTTSKEQVRTKANLFLDTSLEEAIGQIIRSNEFLSENC